MTFVKVVSVGAGVQSSYLALTEEADYYIFADTGDETKETYDFIKTFLLPEMTKLGKTLTIVKWWELYNIPDVNSMYDYYFKINGIPTRQQRSCTERFKIRTIRKFLRNQGISKAEMLLGITTDEFKRMKDSDVLWIDNKFPLIDRGISRGDLEKWWMKNYELIPPKSGCYYCPFITPKRFISYATDNEGIVDKIIKLEENALKSNSQLILFGKYPVKTLWKNEVEQTSLKDFGWFDDQDECEGVCMI